MTTSQETAPRAGNRWNRTYEQTVRDVSTSITGTVYQWSCAWRWPNGLSEVCEDGLAESAALGLTAVAKHMKTEHDVPAIPVQPTG